jgi:hypothetical protein
MITATPLALTAMDDVIDYAETYAANGWPVIPIIPGGKRPPMHSWQHVATTELEIIHQWFANQYTGHGVGVATGNGLFILDVDISNGKTGDETLHELEQAYGPLPDTATVLTGSGGVHYYFTHPDHMEIRNDAGRRLGPGIDIRGEGGQCVAPPTVHANGTPYTWVGGEPAPVAPAPGWLLHMLTHTETPAAHHMATQGPITAPDDSVAARYNQRTTWAGLLTDDGWTLTHTDRSGEQHWTRPGKDERDGTSATVHWNGQDMMRVFTTSIDWLPETAYSRFGYYACRHHAGDRSAAAKHLNELDNAAFNTWQNNLPTTTPTTPTNTPPVDDPELQHGWEPTDLAAIIQTGWEPVKPELLQRADGACLFYPQRINALYGESGSGKTWVAMTTAAQQIAKGNRVLFLDFEDHPGSVTDRMRQLGCADTQLIEQFTYISPVMPFTERAGHYLETLIITLNISLCIIDSTGEAVSMDGINPNADEEIAAWFRKVPRRITRAGATVLLLDHVPKSNESNKRFAIGSQRKLAAIDGASYRVDAITPPAKGMEGKLKLTVAKDRHGNYQHGATVANITVTDTQSGVHVTVTDPDHMQPNDIMETISRTLGMGSQTQNGLLDACKPHPRRQVTTTLEEMIALGYVERTVRTGKGGGFNLSLIKAFDPVDTLTITDKTGPQQPQNQPAEPNCSNRAEPRQPDAEQLPTSNRANRAAPLVKGASGAVQWDQKTEPQTPNQSAPTGTVPTPQPIKPFNPF